MRRLLLIIVGAALVAPVGCITERGDQLGLGLYLAFFGMPIGLLLLGCGIFNVHEPVGTHNPRRVLRWSTSSSYWQIGERA